MAKKKFQANQHVADPRQTLFLSAYLDPKSPTFSNALQSALSVGYGQEYAENITSQMPDWLSESLGEMSMLAKAEKNLNKVLDLNTELGDTGFHSDKLLRIQADVSKFVAERLGRKKYGDSEKPSGNTYNLNVFTDEQGRRIAERFLANQKPSEEKSGGLSDSNES